MTGCCVKNFTIYPGSVDVQLLVKSVFGGQIPNIGTDLNYTSINSIHIYVA